MRTRALLVVTFLLCGLSHHGDAQAGVSFGAGRTRLSLTAGYGSFNDHNYTVLGLGAGYFLAEGFEVGVDGGAWLGSKPHIYTVSPEVRYVVTQLESFKPYLGGFYKRTFYDDTLPNINSAGGRAGFVSPLSEHAYLSAGVVYERLFDCDTQLYDSCTLVYPEVGISLSY